MTVGYEMSPLRKARLERGLSIYDLADAVGISAASISRLERRIQSTSATTAAKLAALLGLSLAQVLLPEVHEEQADQAGPATGAKQGVAP